MRLSDLFLACAVVGGAIWTYSIKHDAEDAADRVSVLAKQIAAEEERIVFLRADWAYLNAPARLEKLVERYGAELELAPVEAHQWVEPFDLPVPDEPEDLPLQAGEVPLVTGSVRAVAPKRRSRAAIPASIDDLLKDR